MHKYITLFFLVTLFLTSCKGNRAPADVIDHEQMISLLTDVHIIDGRMYSVKQDPDSLYKYGLGRYLALFKKHHTDSLQFRKSMQYYATQPTELDAMYEKVLLNLKAKIDSLNTQHLKLPK